MTTSRVSDEEKRTMLIDQWPASHAAWERTRRSLAGGVSTGLRAQMPPHPLFFTRGEGSRIHDVDGNTYTDYVLGWGPLFLGHSHPEVVDAVAAQLPLGQTYGAGHAAEYEAAERVCQAVPGAERVLWSNTGTEANQAAFRLARAFTGRQRIVKFTGNYHGWSDNVLVSYRGSEALSAPRPGVGTRGQSKAAMHDVVVAPWLDLDAVSALIAEGDIAAVIVEPVLANTGVLEAGAQRLAQLRELCTAQGVVLIFDEVITGFRLALGGAREHFGVLPDLSVYAKSIASGFSLAAIAGRSDIIDQVEDGVVHAGTYNGNPIVLTAARATLDVLARERPYDRLADSAARLVTGAREVFARHGVTATAHSVGPIVQMAWGCEEIRSVEDYHRADWATYDELIVALLRRGQFVLPGGRWYLSIAHDDDTIDASLDALDGAVAAVAGGGR